MRVEFLTAISSRVWGAYGAGEVGEIPDDEGNRLIAAGYARPVVELTTGDVPGLETPERGRLKRERR